MHWAKGGETKLSNLVTLCWFHHRLVHEGGFGVHAPDDGVFVFTRPDGSRVEENGWLQRLNLISTRDRTRAADAELQKAAA